MRVGDEFGTVDRLVLVQCPDQLAWTKRHVLAWQAWTRRASQRCFLFVVVFTLQILEVSAFQKQNTD